MIVDASEAAATENSRNSEVAGVSLDVLLTSHLGIDIPTTSFVCCLYRHLLSCNSSLSPINVHVVVFLH